MHNLILNTDSYKTSHFLQYPQGTEYVSSYIESRGGSYPKTLFFGLQIFIKQYLTKPITLTDINEAEEVLAMHGLPFNYEGWMHILKQHNGYLPLEIEAVPEGTLVPTGNVLVQVVNTDPQCAWLTSYIETALLRAIWYPTTVATVSKACHTILDAYLSETADNLNSLPFKLHDFGARGASSEESVAIGSLAHLVNFMGTDSLSGVMAARRYYHKEMAGFSIPAAEHSTITSWGREGEAAAYANMLRRFGGKGKTVAVVSDSYDIWNAIDNIWGGELKSQVENNGGTLVIRPDSGEPVEIVPEAIERLMAKFGYTINSKGYKVLPDFIRLIQGDGVSVTSIEEILCEMKKRKLSAENVSFGMGGELLQKVNRDTQRFAMKASAICIDGEWKDVYKDPITDRVKRSKKGRLALINQRGEFKTVSRNSVDPSENLLIPIYRDGQLIMDYSLDNIRLLAMNDSVSVG
ncbi:nicotinate phosphoribosyltransferase [Pragia fontium]|uniref:Nicotinamide phosphoribosyltransferase n=1 Tax=Pragia fontium TaxID=82985 RepID=A0ABQ5LJI8_9GAMM|nr:nicotinate phosphoribosyltransferase [Pragia fontium]GKX63785.1 nicotinate phosphoribosyltransferase [Pragia fontium]VEJ57103.1 putative nicotinate phosphoribosyltransferase [Pragia fontium]